MICFALLAVSSGALLQAPGSVDQSKRMGFAYLAERNYDRAAAKLEEVWESDQSDPSVAQHLAVAYMNGQERRYRRDLDAKAVQLMTAALEARGRATFLIQHSHERFSLVQGSRPTKYCAGELVISRDRLAFMSRAGDKPGEHSFEASESEIEEASAAGESGSFRLKVRGKNYNLLPQTADPQHTRVLLDLLDRYVKKGKETR